MSQCLSVRRFEFLGIHSGQNLSWFDKVSLSDQDLFYTPRIFCGHINLDRFNPTISIDNPLRERRSLQAAPPLPSEIASHNDDNQQSETQRDLHVSVPFSVSIFDWFPDAV
jgi:hypothetical protein